MDKLTKKLLMLGWTPEFEGLDLTVYKYFNLTETKTEYMDYSKYRQECISLYHLIEYTFNISSKKCYYRICVLQQFGEYGWTEKVNVDYDKILDLALRNELFQEVALPQFINKEKVKWWGVFRELAVLKEDYTNSIDGTYKKGDFFIQVYTPTARNVYFYSISKQQANDFSKAYKYDEKNGINCNDAESMLNKVLLNIFANDN